jgi:diadenosine tetraphosphate (Ap4A) HIT family hydrolase
VAHFPDVFPVTHGHTLVLPVRHCADLFELDAAEYGAVWNTVREVRDELQARLLPAGFTIGVNAGVAAGQTVPHAHVHVIPRFEGDVLDPRGGVRWVIPHRAAYWDVPGA